MSSIIFSLTCLFLTQFFIQPSICAQPVNYQDFEFIDITLLWEQFPSIVDKLKETVTRLRCPKGWKRLGGSCYYLSSLTSTSTDANYTCNQLHSNASNLMQIRNAVELFYATHILSRNNFTSLMVDIDPSLLRGKKIADMLTNDQNRWNRMKQQLRRVRIKYRNSTKKIIDRLNSAGLRIMRRSRKKQQSFKQYQSNDSIIIISSNVTNSDDEYEYDDLDSPDESDEFEQIEDIRGICNQIHWNAFNNNSSVYILTTYIVSNKIVCSLSDVEPNTNYHHICEYVLDYCFANIACGGHGHCINTLSGFRCSCSFLFGGLFCDGISQAGQEIIIAVILIPCIYIIALAAEPLLLRIREKIRKAMEKKKEEKKRKEKEKQDAKDKNEDATDQKTPFLGISKSNQDGNNDNNQQIFYSYRSNQNGNNDNNRQQPTVLEKRVVDEQYIRSKIRAPGPLSSPIIPNLVRCILVGVLVILHLSILFATIIARYWSLFNTDRANNIDIKLLVNNTNLTSLLNDTIHLVKQCERITDYQTGNLIFVPFAITLIVMFSFLIKRQKRCLNKCDGRPNLIIPIEPFRLANRYSSAAVFGILAYEVLKIFEELLFGSSHVSNYGVLVELILRILTVAAAGLRYYPILASLQLSNTVARCFACLYMTGDIIYTIMREGSCMGFIPLSGQYTIVEEAKLRMELGTWFIIYGLIKTTPHFILLSFTTAELWVRLLYDSIYVQIKKKKSICSTPDEQLDEVELSKYYVTKLLRRTRRLTKRTTLNTNRSPDEHETKQEEKANRSKIRKFINSIYHWNDEFRFSTMVLCTYTVAFVFLYYLTCTFIFLNTSRTTGHISFLKSYIESSAKVELKETFSLNREVILSAVITFILFGFQLLIGIETYKKHKIELNQGKYRGIPFAPNYESSELVSNSVHYSGFLVGYMAWGFVICFHVILLIFTAMRSSSFENRHPELVLTILAPVLVVYLLKMTFIRSAAKILFVHETEKQEYRDKLDKLKKRYKRDKLEHRDELDKLKKQYKRDKLEYRDELDKLKNRYKRDKLENRGLYVIFVYFMFFADCFLGIASCVIRLIKATVLNIVYMARLDYSFLGQSLAKHDIGFAAYVSYLHMEVMHTHPINIAFCHILMDLKNKRLRNYYDEDCCTTQNDVVDNDETRYEKKRLERRRKARYRWFFAYTMINNYHLFDISKRFRPQLIRSFLQRPFSTTGQPFTPLKISQGTVNTTIDGASKGLKMQSIPENATILVESQQPNVLHSFSTYNCDGYPLSPAERYILLRREMSYYATKQQPTAPISQFIPRETPIIIQQESINPSLFQAITTSIQSPDDDRTSENSLSIYSSDIRSQKTHYEFMKDWYETKLQNFEKKSRHHYFSGPPPTPSSPNDVPL